MQLGVKRFCLAAGVVLKNLKYGLLVFAFSLPTGGSFIPFFEGVVTFWLMTNSHALLRGDMSKFVLVILSKQTEVS